jgi:hypothetical protein
MAPTPRDTAPAKPLDTTLLDLVLQLNEVTASAEETEQRALEMLASGRARLTGNFRGVRFF